MPVYRFQGPDGRVHRAEADTPEAAQAGLERMWAEQRQRPASSPQPRAPVTLRGIGASLATGAGQGAAPYVDAAIGGGPTGIVSGALRGGSAAGGLAQHLVSLLMPGPRAGLTLPRQFSPMTDAMSRVGHKPQNAAEELAQTVGQMLPAALAPGSAAARALNVLAPALGSEGAGQTVRALGAGPAAETVARIVGGIGGAGVASVRPRSAPRTAPTKAPPLHDVKTADEKAWAAVDASGYRFPRERVKAAADDIRALVDDADPDLYPSANLIAKKVARLAERDGLTPAKANRLRGQVGEKLLAPGSDEVSVGREIKARIDALIDEADDPNISNARDIHTRYLKMKEVTDRVDSAALAQENAGTGGNQNAVRQKLRPLIDPKSPQRMRNLSPDEVKAIRRVNKGTKAQNLLRLLTAFDPTAGKLQAMLSLGAAGASGGTSALLAPVGMAARAGERAIAMNSVDDLLALMAGGGKRPVMQSRAPLRLSDNPYAGIAMPGVALSLSTQATAKDRRHKQ